MKFELNNYHRNTSDDDLIADIIRVSRIIGSLYLTKEQYSKYGNYGVNTYIRHFGSWNSTLKRSGLLVSSRQKASMSPHNKKNSDVSDDDIIDDLRRVASQLEVKTLNSKQYSIVGKFSNTTCARRFGGWDNALIAAGLFPNKNVPGKHIETEDLLKEIERMWIELGRQPTTTDIKNGNSKYSLQSYSRRFGGWRGALEAFVEWINDESDDSGEPEKEIKLFTGAQHTFVEKASHSTNRDINYRLRFKVMQRDNFKCCMCGASPAKDPSVVLHIDHIIPWSKGGETTLENLQTLCSKCNLGKSDLMPE